MRKSSPVVTLLSAAMCLAGAGCDRSPRKGAGPLFGKAAGQNVLLITLDTTRADRLGCYGYKKAATPTLDALAARGALFEKAYCEAPLTLVSHASILTGLFPREHGIHNNGAAALASGQATLATLLKAKGYRTGAFVAAFVLDKRYGLNQGFDTYDDDMGSVPVGAQMLEMQRPGNVVTDRALAWLEKNTAGPFFAWVHYYDPHHPYEPPSPHRERHTDPYDGEIAFTDGQMKRLVDWLAKSGLVDKTTIVVAGDHGESFGEHGERGHNKFLYETNLHVPLIFAGPSIPTLRTPALVQLTDVLPTALELLGVAEPDKLHSRSLTGVMAGQKLDDEECYSESLAVYDSYGYAEQRSLTTSKWKYISSTVPELYDRESDPLEKTNLAERQPDMAKDLLGRLLDLYESMPPGEARKASLSKSAQEGFAALGYFSAGSKSSEEFLTPGLPDPKVMLPTINKVLAAGEFIVEDKLPEAIKLLVAAARESPNSMHILYALGSCYLKQDQPAEAMKQLEEAAKIRPDSSPLMTSLGDCHIRLNQTADAARHYLAALALDDLDAEVHLKLAQAYSAQRRLEDALRECSRAAELNPQYAEAQFQIGFLLAELGRPKEAIEPYRRAVGIRPADTTTRFNLGVALLRVDRLPEAEMELREALRLKPDHGQAANNLGICLAMRGKTDEALRVLGDAVNIPGAAADAHFNIAVTMDKLGRRDEALSHLEKAVVFNAAHDGSVQMLARYYLASRRIADGIRVLRGSLDLAPNNLQFANFLAMLLATAQDDKLRDGKMALTLARKACEATGHRHPGLLATLAAAQAETGDFTTAAATAASAMQLAGAAKQDKLVQSIAAQLEVYRNGRPFRDPRY